MKKIVKVLIIAIAGLCVLAGLALGIAYVKQDELLAEAVGQLNGTFKGTFIVEGSHISPFENFPYISIDLENLRIYEGKNSNEAAVIQVQDAYIGFDFWSVVTGAFEVKKIKLSEGVVNLVQYEDGALNLLSAFESTTTDTTTNSSAGSGVNLELKAIELVNIDFLKTNESNGILAEVYVERIISSFSMSADHIKADLESKALFNLILDGDTSFLHDKHLALNTGIDYHLSTGLLTFSPSKLWVEKASFLMEGSIDLDDDLHHDLRFSGQKPNFDLFLAFAPPELAPLFARYDNGGNVYFHASLQGPAYGAVPHIEVDFGCEEAFVENTEVDKAINDLYFKGHFTNGAKNHPSTMALIIEDFNARPETGNFKGAIRINNFESPDIEMQINSEFNLEFLADFLSIEGLEDISGKVTLDMNFHDIIDLDDPGKAIERVNESYFTELQVDNLNFTSPNFHLPLRDINIHAAIDGHAAIIDQFTARAGHSDISLTATISDLPAIIHHTDQLVDVNLQIEADSIDILELTQTDSLHKGFNEQITDFSVGFQFTSSARAFTESPYLPLGEFLITDLHAQLSKYPHELHDFRADVIIDSTHFNIIDFTGMLDQSDFHFYGNLKDYHLWFQEQPQGTSIIEFDLKSDLIQLQDLFSYGGENYVPQDYRQETFRNLQLHGLARLHFKNKLSAVHLELDHLGARMTQHGINIEDFAGSISADSALLMVKDFGGKVGRSEFSTNLTYHLKADSSAAPHRFTLASPRLDFDQLFSYLPPTPDPETGQVDHESCFNLFELPFTNLHYRFDIAQMNYHRYLLSDFTLRGRMQQDHYLYIDTLALRAAGGEMRLNGYFNGSDPKAIYFSPNLSLAGIDLDQLLFKFDNFGQDQLVSDNLHGQLSGTLSGNIHMHPDLIPVINDSELHIEIEVVNGSLNNFTAFEAMSSYFTDKNLQQVRFDTLRNTLDLKNGDLSIPAMTINTTLGYFEISGRQGLDLDMNYDMRIPVKVIAKAGIQKLFGNKNRDNSDQVDEIQYRDDSKRSKFITVNVSGTPDDYKIKLGKGKDKKKKKD